MRKNCFIPIYIFVIIVISFWYIFFHKISMSAPRVCSTVTPWPRVSTSLVLINVDAIQVTKETEETAEVRCLSFRHFDVIQGNGVLLNNFSKYWEFFFFLVSIFCCYCVGVCICDFSLFPLHVIPVSRQSDLKDTYLLIRLRYNLFMIFEGSNKRTHTQAHAHS